MTRATFRPQGASPPPLGYRSVRQGMANSALQPPGVRADATSHTPRQSMLISDPSSVTSASNSAPLGFVAKTTPLRWSWNGSKRIATASSPPKSIERPNPDLVNSLSRSRMRATIRSGSESCAMMPTYSVRSSYAIRTTVCSVAGRPARGSLCRKSVTEGACSQTFSERTPSSSMPSESVAGMRYAGSSPSCPESGAQRSHRATKALALLDPLMVTIDLPGRPTAPPTDGPGRRCKIGRMGGIVGAPRAGAVRAER